MRGKVKLTCRTCNCTTEIQISERPLVQPFTCQSCGQHLSYPDHEKLSIVMQAIYSLPDFTNEDGFIPEGRGFHLALDVITAENASEQK